MEFNWRRLNRSDKLKVSEGLYIMAASAFPLPQDLAASGSVPIRNPKDLHADKPERVKRMAAPNVPDELFTEAQFNRLQELMQLQRSYRERNLEMPQVEWQELEGLINAEITAAVTRTERYLARVGR